MDGEKERRNLLVVSTAIILFFWLDLPEGLIAERVLGGKIEGQIIAWKIWVAIVAVLIYQMHRYYSVCKDSGNSGRSRDKISKWRGKFIADRVRQEIEGIVNGTITTSDFFDAQYFLIQHKDANGIVDFNSSYIHSIEHKTFDNGKWKGEFSTFGSSASIGRIMEFEYIFPDVHKLTIDAKIAPQFLASELSSEYLVPTVLAYLGLWLAVYRLTELLI